MSLIIFLSHLSLPTYLSVSISPFFFPFYTAVPEQQILPVIFVFTCNVGITPLHSLKLNVWKQMRDKYHSSRVLNFVNMTETATTGMSERQ